MTDQSSSYGIERSTPSERATVTLSAGTVFAIVGIDGCIRADGAQGFYADDTRLISELWFRVDDGPLRVVESRTADRGLCVAGTVGDPTSPYLLVDLAFRLDERLTVALGLENLTAAARDVTVDLHVTTDFADVFEVKRGVRARGGLVTFGAEDEDLVLRYQNRDFRRGVKIEVDRPDEVLRDGIHVVQRLGPRATATVTATASPVRGEHHDDTPFGPESQTEWLGAVPSAPDCIPAHIWDRSWRDICTLLMRDALEPHPLIVAAGSPWFMALFGRDSLIASLETLPYRTDLAMGVLHALAARQGRGVDATTLEEPGRLPHEVRRGEVVQRPDGWGAIFYGTVDATPLFVMTLAEAWRRGADADAVAALLPAAERAVEWILGPGDPDGDGFVEYPGTVHGQAGLANQAWKDSDDAIRHPDGTLATGPIAAVEVQGYAHAALAALAELREVCGTGDPAPLVQRAGDLQAAIEAQFWLDDEDCYALALDGDKRPVRAVSSNAGHLLFTGTATGDRAARLVRRLMADDMFTGFGLRTLSASNAGYNPLSYHCGSVWPHDTALVAAGMLRQGFDEGVTLTQALLDAADDRGRLPELFGGFARSRRPRPLPYPTSCSPQAWAAGAPLLLAAHLPHVTPEPSSG
jgi:hypothetical protein